MPERDPAPTSQSVKNRNKCTCTKLCKYRFKHNFLTLSTAVYTFIIKVDCNNKLTIQFDTIHNTVFTILNKMYKIMNLNNRNVNLKNVLKIIYCEDN